MNKSSEKKGDARHSRLHELLLPSKMTEHHKEWNRDNMDALWLICSGGLALSIFGIVLSFIDGNRFQITPYLLYLCLFLGFFFLIWLFRKKIEKYPLAAIYILNSLIFLVDIQLETNMQEQGAFVFCILQISLAICYVDYPLRIFIFQLIFSILFIVVDAHRRSGFLFRLDVTRIFLGLVAALILYTFMIYRRNRLTDAVIGTQETASRDALTGIFNRGAGQTRISDLASAGLSGTFVLMDVDNFKHINDTYGHGKGDEVLQAVAAVLAASFRSTDVVMRMGGDEFMAYALGMVDERYVERKMKDIQENMHEIVLDEETGDHVSVSAGCLINLGSYKTYDDLYAAADRLLYEAKQMGKDRYRISNKDV